MYNRQHFERYLSKSEEKQLFACVQQFKDVLARRDGAWMQFMRQTGVRVMPMSLFTVGDALATLASGKLMVRGDINKRGIAYSSPCNKAAQKCLRDLLAIRLEMGYANKDHGEILVMSRNHKGMSIRSYQARMKYWLARAGMNTDASPHWLRHTLSKRILQTSTSVNPLRIVQVALGHRSLNSTAIYTLPDKEELVASMEAAS